MTQIVECVSGRDAKTWRWPSGAERRLSGRKRRKREAQGEGKGNVEEEGTREKSGDLA